MTFSQGDQRALSIVDEPVDLEPDTPAPLLMNLVLLEAVRHRASDVHFELFSEHMRIRIRVDGVMQGLRARSSP